MVNARHAFVIKGTEEKRAYEIRAGYYDGDLMPRDSGDDSPVSFYRVYLNGELQNPYTYKTLERAMEDVTVNYEGA